MASDFKFKQDLLGKIDSPGGEFPAPAKGWEIAPPPWVPPTVKTVHIQASSNAALNGTYLEINSVAKWRDECVAQAIKEEQAKYAELYGQYSKLSHQIKLALGELNALASKVSNNDMHSMMPAWSVLNGLLAAMDLLAHNGTPSSITAPTSHKPELLDPEDLAQYILSLPKNTDLFLSVKEGGCEKTCKVQLDSVSSQAMDYTNTIQFSYFLKASIIVEKPWFKSGLSGPSSTVFSPSSTDWWAYPKNTAYISPTNKYAPPVGKKSGGVPQPAQAKQDAHNAAKQDAAQEALLKHKLAVEAAALATSKMAQATEDAWITQKQLNKWIKLTPELPYVPSINYAPDGGSTPPPAMKWVPEGYCLVKTVGGQDRVIPLEPQVYDAESKDQASVQPQPTKED